MADANPPAATPLETTCARCRATVSESDRVTADNRVFCRTCYEILKLELRRGVASLSEDVNYPMAALGAVLGGVVGVLAWWGFTVLTNIGFGLVAVVIGFLVGHGAARFAGGKRSAGLQGISVAVAVLSFLVAVYLVNMTFINAALVERGDPWRVTFPPASLDMFYRVVTINFGIMKLVFLAIVAYEAWIIPRPIMLPQP
jgi:hypothetical protein